MRESTRRLRSIFVVVGLIFFLGCVQEEKQTQVQSPTIKNLILIIGDGMGPQQIGLLLTYAQLAPNSVIKDRVTAFEKMMDKGVLGIAMSYTANTLVADSAASSTQIASGVYAGSEMVGLDQNGNPVETILEKAKKIGKSTGLISDNRVTHATPAGFAAHQPHRSLESEIAVDMLNTGPDIMLSGGLRSWIPKEANDQASSIRKELEELTEGNIQIESTRKDSRNLVDEAIKKGYAVAFNKSQMEKANGKILGLFAYSSLPDGIRETRTKNSPDRTIPTLKEMSAKALTVLSQNENGFFLMIEAGQIDTAAHYHDTGTMLHEMLKINEILEYVLGWAKNHEDTLIVVTADHETGGFGFSYSAYNIPKAIALPGSGFKASDFQPNFNFGKAEILDRLYNQQISYDDIFFNIFDNLSEEDQTPSKLAEIVNQHTDFKITEEQAIKILATEENPFYVEGHQYLYSKTVPKMEVMGAFFPYQMDDNRQNLLAREVAESQNVVWSTGTHTNTPVMVFALGPEKAMFQFKGFLHHVKIGQYLIDVLETN
ncbi:alkaline phosphatase [Acidobacteriota bacterium]